MKSDSSKCQSLAISDPGETSSSILINGRSVSFKKSGTGSPLVVFHGWIGDEDTFAPCNNAFAQHYTVYRPAWPGYGKSSPLPNFSIEDLAEIGRQFILATGNAPVTLVGNCLGGVVAVELIRLYPKLVKQLILIEMYDYMPWYLHVLLIPKLNIFLYNLLFKSTTHFRILNRLLTTKFVREGKGMRYTEEGFRRTAAQTATDFLKAVKGFENKLYREQYHTDIATIYVEGGRSFKPISAFRATAIKYFSNLTIVSMPESLHMPIAEQPERFSANVLHHLGHSISG